MTERKQSGKRDRGSTLARDSRDRTRSLFLRTQSLYASMAAGSGVGDDYAGSAATASSPRRSCGRGRKSGSWRRRWGRCPWDRGQMRTESPRGGRGGGGGAVGMGRIGALSSKDGVTCDGVRLVNWLAWLVGPHAKRIGFEAPFLLSAQFAWIEWI
jgi:hypothetical protein